MHTGYPMSTHGPDSDHAAPSICRDPVTGRPVFVAPQRSGKPDDHALVERLGAESGPLGWCPFCAGNEGRTPPAVLRSPADESVPWRARIVPNTFPIAVSTTQPPTAENRLEAVGIHEVVVESPRHYRSILEIGADAWRDVWSLCHRRLAVAAEMECIAFMTIFKNSGRRAGASLEHVHSQIVGIGVVPPAIETETSAVRRESATFPRLIEAARAEGRIVAEREGVAALVPPAPRQPFETWLITTIPEPHFHVASPQRVAATADLVRDVVARLERLAPACHYNWWLHQAAFIRSRDDERTATSWHWHLEVLPRLSELAGFELGTGCHITTRSPRDSARMLREAGDESV